MNSRINYLVPEGVTSGIYKLTASDGHYYIGSTNRFIDRYHNHKRLLQKGTHSNSFMQRVYNKTSDVWVFELVELCSKERLAEMENKHLSACAGQQLCMNICSKANWHPGVPGPKPWVKGSLKGVKRGPYRPRSVEHSKAISEAKKGIKTGPKSEQACNNLSNALKGRKLSPEHRAKLSAAKIGNTPWNKGKHLTPEHIRKRQMSRFLNH